MQEGDGTAYVWAADSQDKIEKRQVTLGEYDGELDLYEITEGLTREDYIAFPSSDIQAGMDAERNIENATIGTGAASASGIGDGETYIGSDADTYSDYTDDESYSDSDFSMDETGEEQLDNGDVYTDDLGEDEVYYDDGAYTDDGEYLDEGVDDGSTDLIDGGEETAAPGEE